MKKVETMDFKFDTGSSFSGGDAVPKSVRQLMDFLDRLPDGKLIDKMRCSELSGIPYMSLEHNVHLPFMGQYKTLRGGRIVLGNTKTVASWNALSPEQRAAIVGHR